MRRLLAYLGVPLVLAGCGIGEALSAGGDQPPWVDLTPVALVGVWRSDQGDAIEFTADGEFYGDDVRYMFAGGDLAAGLDLSQDTAAGSGHWHLTTALGDPKGKHAFVGLSFDVVANQPAAVAIDKLLARRIGGATELDYSVGDPDLRNVVAYRRCEANCPHLAPDRRSLGVPTAARRAQLVGVWRDQHGARLVLHADGSYAAEDLRFAYAAAEKLLPYRVSPASGPLSSTGSWSTKPPEHDPSGPETTVVLAIGKVAGRPSFGVRPLRIHARGQHLVLVTSSSNPGVIEQHVFHRAPATASTK